MGRQAAANGTVGIGCSGIPILPLSSQDGMDGDLWTPSLALHCSKVQ